MKNFEILTFILSNMLPHMDNILVIIYLYHFPDLINQQKS